MPATNFTTKCGKQHQKKKSKKNQDTTIMKAKYALVALLALTFFGCDDNTGGIGSGMFPDSDQNINGRLSNFDVTTQSIKAGNIYAVTSEGYVGKFTDQNFGAYSAGFLTELNCPKGMTFPDVYQEFDAQGNPVAEGKGVKATGSMISDGTEVDLPTGTKAPLGNVYATEIYLWYNKYFGAPDTPCRLSVYKLKKGLDKDQSYYTDINPEDYYSPNDPQALLGRKSYTAVDLSVSEETRNKEGYVPSVRVAIKNEIGKSILTDSRKEPAKLADLFKKSFPGIYVKSDFGDGTILYVAEIQMNVVYKIYVTDSKTGLKLKKKYEKDANGAPVDSTDYRYRSFNATKEILQANQFVSDQTILDQLIKDGTVTYMKTPAGIFTEATIPVSDIENKLANDTINAVKLAFRHYNETETNPFGMKAPDRILLIREKEKDSFFEKNKLADNITSYISARNTSQNEYTFNNISKLLKACFSDKKAAEEEIKKNGKVKYEVLGSDGKFTTKETSDINVWKAESTWNKVVIIPVVVEFDTQTNANQQPQIISISHDLKPSYVRLKGGANGMLPGDTYKDNRLKLEIVSTNFNGIGKK